MRYKNVTGDLKLYAVAGTQTVLLAFDIAKSKVDGKDFMGFSVSRTDSDGTNKVSLNGSKHFDSLLKDNTITDPKIKFASLVQSFFWKDYIADPGKKYKYTVKAMFGTARNFVAKFESTITVTTEELNKGKHSVYFNFGVTGSQGYANKKEFENKRIFDLPKPLFEKAMIYLGRELYEDGVKKFIQQAGTKKHSLYCAFYEIQFPGVLKDLKAIKPKCKDLQIVYNGKPEQNEDSEHEKGNFNALKAAGLASVSHIRTKASQPHNKFMILCKDDEPIEVWTGSTNLTYSGLFGQSNTGHWIKDKAIAKKFKQYWDMLKDNPSLNSLGNLSETIQPNADLTQLDNGSYVFFSPRNRPVATGTTAAQLESYVHLIDKAKELVCMVFPFNFDKVFKDVYNKKRNYLRYLMFEKESEAKNAKVKADSDINLKVTGGSALESKVEQFVKEVTPATTVEGGIKYVHNKFILIDPLGDNPIVLSGSANFSNTSIGSNDENSVLIKGDARVADIYLTEFNRLFEHFWPRFLHKITPRTRRGFSEPLDEAYTWFVNYFKPDSYHHKRGQLFIKMKGAKNG